MKLFKLNLWYGILLIILGLWGFLGYYIEQGSYAVTSLIPLFFGLLFIFFTSGVKKDNAIIGHLSGLLVLILLIMSVVMLVKNSAGGFELHRKSLIFIFIIIFSVIMIIAQVKYFIDRRKASNS